jgi:hypothetical protein
MRLFYEQFYNDFAELHERKFAEVTRFCLADSQKLSEVIELKTTKWLIRKPN